MDGTPEATEMPKVREPAMIPPESETSCGSCHNAALPQCHGKNGMPKAKPLLDFSKLPEYLRDNEYIHKHYRADWPLSQTLWSIFGIHNETGNIWTHLVGFWIFFAITVYTAMKIPSVIETPLSSLNLHRLQDRLLPALTLGSFGHSSGSQLQNSLTRLAVPELPSQLAKLQGEVTSVNVSGRWEQSLYTSVPGAPRLSKLDAAAHSGPQFEALTSTSKLPELPHLPTLVALIEGAQNAGGHWYDTLQGLPNRAVQVQDKADVYFLALTEQLNENLPDTQGLHDAAELFITAVSEKLSHLFKIRDIHDAAEQYFAVMAEWLSHVEVLHTHHSREMVTRGMEVSRVQEALHSLVTYYSCLLTSPAEPLAPAADPLDMTSEDTSTSTCQTAKNLSPRNSTCAQKQDSSPANPPNSAAPSCPKPMLYSTPTVRWPLFVFLGGAMVCLLLSASCHLLGCVSCDVSKVVWCFDYAGIAGLLCGSFFPPVYYSFLCQPVVRGVYLTIVMIMGIATITISVLPQFQKTEFRHVRAGFFVAMGASGIIPTAHKFFFYHDEPTRMVITTTLLELLMGSMYGLGALFYATRIPERWLPGKFDIAGHSHQIFHVLVASGAYTHYRTALLYLEWRDVHGCGGM